jgi:hypothetical protein
MICRRLLVVISDSILLCSEFHIVGVEERKSNNTEFFVAFVNPTFPLQISSLTNFVSCLGNVLVIRASTIKLI